MAQPYTAQQVEATVDYLESQRPNAHIEPCPDAGWCMMALPIDAAKVNDVGLLFAGMQRSYATLDFNTQLEGRTVKFSMRRDENGPLINGHDVKDYFFHDFLDIHSPGRPNAQTLAQEIRTIQNEAPLSKLQQCYETYAEENGHIGMDGTRYCLAQEHGAVSPPSAPRSPHPNHR